jgi:uncharacterized protein
LQFQSFLRGSLANDFDPSRRYRIGVTGSTGMIGRRVVDLISVLGHQAVRILRPASHDRPQSYSASSPSVVWNPGKGFSDDEVMENLDAVIHLGGRGIASTRWTDAAKRSIRESRVQGTTQLVREMLKLSVPPITLVSASGVGYYGDRASTSVDEFQGPGNDFLAKLAVDWEGAANTYAESGRRVAIGRLGIVMHPREGALAKLLLPFRLGLGGPIGNGSQYWSWIHVDDAAAAFIYLALNQRCNGAYNLVAPEQTDNRTFAKTLGRVLSRPAIIPAPAFAMRVLLGEMADAMLLASTRAESKRLSEANFPFRTPDLEACFRQVLGLA